MNVRNFFAIALLGLSLGGCVNAVNAWNTLTSATVPPKEILIAAQGVNGIEATAKNYLHLVRCNGSNGPICRDPAATAKIIPAVRSLRTARNDAINFLKTHPGQLGPSGLVDAINQAASTLQDIYGQYNIK